MRIACGSSLGWLRLATLTLLCVTALGARAQDATWVGGNAGDPNEWGEPANWTPTNVPTATAIFTSTGITTVANDNGVVAIGAIDFTGTPNAQAYTINIDNPFIVNSAGVTNNSTNTQTFNITSGNTLVFQNSSTANNGAGVVIYNNQNGGFIEFNNNSNAGNVNTTINNFSILQFNDSGSAGNAQITNNTEMDFFSSASAGNANITNASGGTITFNNSTTASTATIANAGTIDFSNSSMAGTANITNNSGGTMSFENTSNAASATIINNSGGSTTFGTSGGTDTSTAGSATITNNGGSITFNAMTAAGTANITDASGGTLTFNDSSSSGGATIANNSSFIFFNNNASAGSASIQNSGAITFANSSTAGAANIVTQAGGFLLSFADASTAGIATITTNNSSETQFTGNATGGSARFITNAGGVVDFSASTGPGGNNQLSAGSIEGAGNYYLGSNALTVGDGLSTTVSGVISDCGLGGTACNNSGATGGSLIKVGTSTLTLTAINTYTGGTTINGGVLALSGTGSIANSSVTDNATFDISGLTNGGTTIISLAGSGAVTLGVNTLTLSNAGGTFSGAIGGGGGLTIATGIETLTGKNTYTGVTTINGGTLALSGTGSIANSSVNDRSTFDISGLTNGGTSIVSLAGNGAVTLGANTLTLSNASGAFSGAIGGSGGLTIAAGIETLIGTNTYTGVTTINGGTLALSGTGSIANSSVNDNATFDISSLTNGGTSIVSLVGSGTVRLGANALTLSNASGAFSGVIGGSGGLALTAGMETLSGANTYSGGTALNGGTLVVGNNSALGTGTLAMAAGTTLSFLNSNFTVANHITITGDPNVTPPPGTTQMLSGVIADGASPGTLNVNGAGTLVLSATNTYTGPTNVNSGTLDITGSIASSTLTTVESGGTLTGNGTIGNLMIASGGAFKPGSGTAGTTTTVAGSLAFQSGAIYLVQINPTSASSAKVAGTTSLTGTVDAVFASGPYLTRQYVILQSAGLNGTTFSGLSTTDLPADARASLAYTTDDVLLNLSVSLPTTGLNVNQQNVANTINNFVNSGGTISPGFAGLFNLTGSGLANSLTQLDGEDATGAEHGAFELTNEFLSLMLDPFVYGRGGPASGGSVLGFAPDQKESFPSDVALAYAGLLKAPPKQAFDQRWSVWGASYGGSGTFNGDPAIGSTNVTASTYGFAAGADYHATPDTVLGLALAGAGTNWGLDQALGTGRSDAFQAGFYGTKYFGPAYLGAAFAFTNNWFTTNRVALGDELTARFQGQSYGVRAEGGYRYAVAPSMGVTPYAAIQAQNFHTPTYNETDLTGGGLGLTYNAMTATDTRSELGARFDALTAWGAMPLELRARLAWAHDWVDNPALSATFQTLPGSSFVVNGAPVPNNSVLTTLGAELHLAPRWTLIGKFDGEFANSAQIYAGSGTLRYTW